MNNSPLLCTRCGGKIPSFLVNMPHALLQNYDKPLDAGPCNHCGGWSVDPIPTGELGL